MMKIFLILSLAVFSILPSHSATLEACKISISSVNKSLPIRKDNLTIVKEAACLPGSPKNRFVYILEVGIDAELARKINFDKEIKPGVLKTFCTDPQVRNVINLYDVDHRYYTKKGEYVGSFLMTSKECM